MLGFLKTLFGGAGTPGRGGPSGAAGTRAEALSRVREAQQRMVTPERAELLRQAMEVHRAKQKILADLDDEKRQKLVALALRKLLNEGRDDPKD